MCCMACVVLQMAAARVREGELASGWVAAKAIALVLGEVCVGTKH